MRPPRPLVVVLAAAALVGALLPGPSGACADPAGRAAVDVRPDAPDAPSAAGLHAAGTFAGKRRRSAVVKRGLWSLGDFPWPFSSSSRLERIHRAATIGAAKGLTSGALKGLRDVAVQCAADFKNVLLCSPLPRASQAPSSTSSAAAWKLKLFTAGAMGGFALREAAPRFFGSRENAAKAAKPTASGLVEPKVPVSGPPAGPGTGVSGAALGTTSPLVPGAPGDRAAALPIEVADLARSVGAVGPGTAYVVLTPAPQAPTAAPKSLPGDIAVSPPAGPRVIASRHTPGVASHTEIDIGNLRLFVVVPDSDHVRPAAAERQSSPPQRDSQPPSQQRDSLSPSAPLPPSSPPPASPQPPPLRSSAVVTDSFEHPS
ncbi:MAG: hypothetical protein BJ554DRAFT_2082 [Olpidium bornovanus]|uniref:Uncharacterized protein n=1 Tax=Olpidium bornovanus TaxID=278681 RepID=A0A8H7ZR22_9FUNG|nr:MAG: hypothetical protein BJ554DRAFT_2082 [Olpidium bornovanus]